MLIKAEDSLFLTFLKNVKYVALINTALVLFFVKGLDAVNNPFKYLVGVTLVSALLVTLVNYYKQTSFKEVN